MFLKNRNISSKIKRSKVTDYAALSLIDYFPFLSIVRVNFKKYGYWVAFLHYTVLPMFHKRTLRGMWINDSNEHQLMHMSTYVSIWEDGHISGCSCQIEGHVHHDLLHAGIINHNVSVYSG